MTSSWAMSQFLHVLRTDLHSKGSGARANTDGRTSSRSAQFRRAEVPTFRQAAITPCASPRTPSSGWRSVLVRQHHSSTLPTDERPEVVPMQLPAVPGRWGQAHQTVVTALRVAMTTSHTCPCPQSGSSFCGSQSVALRCSRTQQGQLSDPVLVCISAVAAGRFSTDVCA
jgi:hypothetical protein